MKWVIYLLLLANIGFALWHFRSQDILPNQKKTSDDQALRLILLKEYTAATAPAATNTPAQIQQRCFTLGPFKTTQAAATVRTQLAKAGIEAQNRVSKENTRPGFWVYLPPTATRKAAQDHVAELKARNLKDYFLVATGEYTNAISLGVFSQPDLAQRRSEEITALGFEVKLQKVDLPLREYWLDWPISRVVAPATMESIRAENNGVGQAERACSAPS